MEYDYNYLLHKLSTVYSQNEAKAIIFLVMEKLFRISSTDVYSGKIELLSVEEKKELESVFCRLMKNEPVQYVLGKADFFNNEFIVKPGILIPRPETEELVNRIINDSKSDVDDYKYNINILDVGTGSGCIAIALSQHIKGATVTGWDISDIAVDISKQNALLNKEDVTFEKVDILDRQLPAKDNRSWDIIVSNPPYICDREKSSMEKNVLDYEPASALFVPDDDPLIFYKAITGYANANMQEYGKLYFEVNPEYAYDVEQLMKSSGFEYTEVYLDENKKARFVKGILNIHKKHSK